VITDLREVSEGKGQPSQQDTREELARATVMGHARHNDEMQLTRRPRISTRAH
jgi:hypothetical protein